MSSTLYTPHWRRAIVLAASLPVFFINILPNSRNALHASLESYCSYTLHGRCSDAKHQDTHFIRPIPPKVEVAKKKQEMIEALSGGWAARKPKPAIDLGGGNAEEDFAAALSFLKQDQDFGNIYFRISIGGGFHVHVN
jgi:hypothetical protein